METNEKIGTDEKKEIPMLIGVLRERFLLFEELINELYVRLEVITVDIENKKEKEVIKKLEQRSPLGYELEEFKDRLDKLIAIVRNLINRLCI